MPGAPRRLATSQKPGYAAATWLSADPHAAPLEYHVVRVRRYQDDGTWSRWTSRRLSGAARRASWGPFDLSALYEVSVAAVNRYGSGPARHGSVHVVGLPPSLPQPPPPTLVPQRVFHVFVVTPSDVMSTVTDAAVRHDVELTVGWFAGQTGGRVPRLVRAPDGSLTVTRVTLPATQAALEGAGDGNAVTNATLSAFTVAYPLPEAEQAVMFVGVRGPACGTTGVHVLLWMPTCSIFPSETTTRFPFGSTYLLAHEMTHAFGAVDPCAPHSDRTRHVNDDPRDVLYSGPLARDFDHLMLDPGGDDYFGLPPARPAPTSPHLRSGSDIRGHR